MAEKQWVSIPFSDSWIEKILDLRFKVFHETSYTRSRWEWQYQKNPQGKAHLALAVDDKTGTILAGHYAIMAFRFKYQNEILSVSQSVDTFTNPDFQKQGIFIDLANISYDMAEKDGVAGIFGFPNANSYPGFVKKLGFIDPFALQYWVKPLSLGVILKKLKLPAAIGEFFGKIPLFISPDNSRHFFREVKELPKDWDILLQRFEKNFVVGTHRDSAYMNWRYFNCPDRKYRFFEYRKNNQLLGFAVLAITGDDYPTGQIVDLIFDDYPLGKKLIQHCVATLHSWGAYTAVTYLHKENRIAQTYSSLGFNPRGSETRFILRNLGRIKDFETVAAIPANWYLTGGDTDYF